MIFLNQFIRNFEKSTKYVHFACTRLLLKIGIFLVLYFWVLISDGLALHKELHWAKMLKKSIQSIYMTTRSSVKFFLEKKSSK